MSLMYRLMAGDGEWHLLRKPQRGNGFAPTATCGAGVAGQSRSVDFADANSIPRPLCRPCLASHEAEIDAVLAANPKLARAMRGANPRLTQYG